MSERGDRDGDDDIDDASLRSMRAVWLSMRDEEPPAAGMSALLAAAREQAEQRRAQPAWWQRLFAQLRRPPALAFATVMLLIGGAVLVTRSADEPVDAMKAEPPAVQVREEQMTAPATTQPPAAEPPPPAESTEPATAPADPRPPSKDVAPSRPKKQKPRNVIEDVGKNEPDRHNRFSDDDVTAKPGFTGGKGSEPTTVLESPAGGAAPPRPQPPKQAEAKEAAEPTADSVRVTETGHTTTPNEQLARQAESAASRGDCAAVRAIVARMKQQDEAFYKTRLGKNAAVTKCL